MDFFPKLTLLLRMYPSPLEWLGNTPETDAGVDVSINHGLNTFDFFVSNSLNASYGPGSPTDADSGGFRLDQTVFNVDVTYPLMYQSSLGEPCRWH